MKMNGRISGLIILVLLCSACHKPTGTVSMHFTFSVDGDVLQQDTILYQNAAGNQYEVTEAQYFISNVILTSSDGTQYAIKSDNCAHYVDADIPGTLLWHPSDELPAGAYKAVTFVFGLAPELNVTHAYTDAPENNMSWPAVLGGGYHYMKINGRWLALDGTAHPFNLHSGRVLTAEGDTIEHSFTVTLPLAQKTLSKGEVMDITLDMNINKWFSSPYNFDFNEYGGSIMQNAAAQEVLEANGWDVFQAK